MSRLILHRDLESIHEQHCVYVCAFENKTVNATSSASYSALGHTDRSNQHCEGNEGGQLRDEHQEEINDKQRQ